MHRFRGNDGNAPYAALIQGTDGNLYGIDSSGGPYSDVGNASGTAFGVTTTGEEATVYAFCSLSACVDGYMPIGSLVQGKDGNLYGTTTGGGTSFNGTVFRISLKK